MRLENLPVHMKIVCLLLLLSVSSGACAIYASIQLDTVDQSYGEAIDSQGKGAVALTRSRRALTGIVVRMFQGVTAADETSYTEAMDALRNEEKLLSNQFERSRKALPQLASTFNEQEETYKALMNAECGEVIRRSKSTSDSDVRLSVAKQLNDTCAKKIIAISDAMGKIIDGLQAEVDAIHVRLAEETQRAKIILLIVIAIGTFSVIALAIHLSRKFISLPLRGLMQAMSELGKGNYAIEIVGTNRLDEVGEMAKTVADLRGKLSEGEALREAQSRAQAEKEKRQSVVARAVEKFEGVVGKIVGSVNTAASHLEQAATSLTKTASSTQSRATTVAAASEQTSTNVQGVAAASEELATTVSEIARQVHEGASITSMAVEQADKTNAQVSQLAEAANRIGDVVGLINTIAGQTNLLALNATIEAARAGEMGKGFAVVAQEVKALADQTSKATSEIASQISNMQVATHSAVEAIKEITHTVSKVSSITGAIAAAVEEQEVATKEITRNVADAARGTTEVANNIGDVGSDAVATGAASVQVLSSAKLLSKESDILTREVHEFLTSIKAA